MTRESTRRAAIDQPAKYGGGAELEPDMGTGLRQWFDQLPSSVVGMGAALDTRMDASPLLTGRASKGIAARLRHHGLRMVAPPESFLVDKGPRLLHGEEMRAKAWGWALASVAAESVQA